MARPVRARGAGVPAPDEVRSQGRADGRGIRGPAVRGQVEDRGDVVELALGQQQPAGRAGDEDVAEGGADPVLADPQAPGDRLGLVEPAEVPSAASRPASRAGCLARMVWSRAILNFSCSEASQGRAGPPDQGVDPRPVEDDQAERQQRRCPGPRRGSAGPGVERACRGPAGRTAGPGPPADREQDRADLGDHVIPGHDRIRAERAQVVVFEVPAEGPFQQVAAQHDRGAGAFQRVERERGPRWTARPGTGDGADGDGAGGDGRGIRVPPPSAARPEQDQAEGQHDPLDRRGLAPRGRGWRRPGSRGSPARW